VHHIKQRELISSESLLVSSCCRLLEKNQFLKALCTTSLCQFHGLRKHVHLVYFLARFAIFGNYCWCCYQNSLTFDDTRDMGRKVTIPSVVVVRDEGVIKSDMKSCTTFATSVRSLRKSTANLWLCRSRQEPRSQDSGSVLIFHVYDFGSVFLHASFTLVRLPSLIYFRRCRQNSINYPNQISKFVFVLSLILLSVFVCAVWPVFALCCVFVLLHIALLMSRARNVFDGVHADLLHSVTVSKLRRSKRWDVAESRLLVRRLHGEWRVCNGQVGFCSSTKRRREEAINVDQDCCQSDRPRGRGTRRDQARNPDISPTQSVGQLAPHVTYTCRLAAASFHRLSLAVSAPTSFDTWACYRFNTL